MDAQIAAQYGVKVSELPALNAAITSTSNKLAAVENQADALFRASAARNQKPDQSKLDALNAQRYLTVISGIAAIRKTVEPASWTNLRGYINNHFRNATQVIR